jgi:sugar (pentulose or hexulose) kinase
LKKDCLCYLDFKGNPVKASRLFAGHFHDEQVKRIGDHFNSSAARFRSMPFNPELAGKFATTETGFEGKELSSYTNSEEAYHALLTDLVSQQYTSTQLVLSNTPVKRIFVDGGFSKNEVFMNLLAARFPELEVFAASIHQSTALGAALALHKAWNKKPVPSNLITLRFYDHMKVI